MGPGIPEEAHRIIIPLITEDDIMKIID
jgi:hypothetical protein